MGWRRGWWRRSDGWAPGFLPGALGAPLTHFQWVPFWSSHDPILSNNGVSGKPGAVQLSTDYDVWKANVERLLPDKEIRIPVFGASEIASGSEAPTEPRTYRKWLAGRWYKGWRISFRDARGWEEFIKGVSASPTVEFEFPSESEVITSLYSFSWSKKKPRRAKRPKMEDRR
jgi:hypothetical protein